MLITKFFVAIILINTSMSGCSSSNNNSNVDDTALNSFCQSFAKVICTKDTVTFYKLVDKEALTTSMNEWMQGNKKVTQEDLFFPFFFVYSPLKIRNQDLINERIKEKFFGSFKIISSEVIDELNTKLNLEWVQNLPEANPQKIELYLRKSNEWKVVKVRWDTL